jgi:hypothetical protein
MSDHGSGPGAQADPSSDICDLYAFPSPERAGHLVLAMDLFPFAGLLRVFSDAVMCRFRLRPVTIAATGPAAGFDISDSEFTFDCTFEVPVQRDGSAAQEGRCTSPAGESVAFTVGDEKGGRGEGLRVFAGLRSDPFFMDGVAIAQTIQTGRLALREPGTNGLHDSNILSLVLDVECAALLGGGPLLAVVAETLAVGKRPVRLERQGRPEIKNITLGPKVFDTVNRDLEIRALYNAEDAFHLRKEYLGAYRARLNANLAFYDGLDGKNNWPLGADGSHPLTHLLLHDFLVVDVSKPYAEDSYLEIERAMLQDRAPTTCGGRSLNDDFVDTYLTLLVNAGNGPRISDGVDHATVPASRVFPYLAPPNHPAKPVVPGVKP